MRQLPDANVSESLQHVPGVSLQSDSGFGRFLTVRGLSPDLNTTEYAGIELSATNVNANPNGGSRAVALDFIPPRRHWRNRGYCHANPINIRNWPWRRGRSAAAEPAR